MPFLWEIYGKIVGNIETEGIFFLYFIEFFFTTLLGILIILLPLYGESIVALWKGDSTFSSEIELFLPLPWAMFETSISIVSSKLDLFEWGISTDLNGGSSSGCIVLKLWLSSWTKGEHYCSFLWSDPSWLFLSLETFNYPALFSDWEFFSWFLFLFLGSQSILPLWGRKELTYLSEASVYYWIAGYSYYLITFCL